MQAALHPLREPTLVKIILKRASATHHMVNCIVHVLDGVPVRSCTCHLCEDEGKDKNALQHNFKQQRTGVISTSQTSHFELGGCASSQLQLPHLARQRLAFSTPSTGAWWRHMTWSIATCTSRSVTAKSCHLMPTNNPRHVNWSNLKVQVEGGRACAQLQEAAGESAGGDGVPGVLLVAQGHQRAVKGGEQAAPHRKAPAYPRRLPPDRLCVTTAVSVQGCVAVRKAAQLSCQQRGHACLC